MPVINIHGKFRTITYDRLHNYANICGMSSEQFLHRHGQLELGYQGIPFVSLTPNLNTATLTTGFGETNPENYNADLHTFLNQTTTPQPSPPDIFDSVSKPPPTSNNLPLQQLVKYKPMVLRKTDSSAYERAHTVKDKPFEWCSTQGMVGIEIEVENITNSVATAAYWDIKTDGSLRNNGIEMVSVPLQIKQVQLALEHAYEALNQNNKPDFSNRTSIHIHVNCRDLTQDQLYNFILLYAIFEKHFYTIAGNKRLNSIFCVPVFRTNLLNQLHSVVYDLSSSWHKYCGINLLPLFQNSVTQGYGTIEFRHLYGTSNQREILEWINDILCLRKYACEISKDDLLNQIKEMNTTSSYLSLYSQVFAKGRKILTNKKDFEECISNTKRELFGDEYINTLKRSDQCPYWTTVNELGIRG